jgi:hypothetical protein
LNASKDLSLDINNFNLDELDIQEETQEEASTEVNQEKQFLQIQLTNQPYGTPSSSK